jgi:hypothetical protein
MKHLHEDELILLHYGESRNRSAKAHVAACDACRAQLRELSRALQLIDVAAAPERDSAYGNAVWNRIRGQLPERGPGWREQLRASWPQPRAWAALGAVATLLVAAFLVGRFWTPSQPHLPPQVSQGSQPAPEKIRERVLLVTVGSHLERSQMILVELANAPASDGVDISVEQRRAQDLLSDNRLYRQTAARAGDANVAAVLDQLERLLIDIAHRPSRLSKSDIQRLQRQINSQGLVFKIRVVESNVRNQLRRNKPAATPSRTLSSPRQTT